MMQLIDGLYIPEQSRILQSMQDNDMTLEQTLSHLQQWDLIQNYTRGQFLKVTH